MKKIILLLGLLVCFSTEIVAAPFKEFFVTVNPALKLRVVKVESFASSQAQGPKNVIILLPGRSSFYEKNQDFVEILAGHSDSMTQQQQPPIQNPFREINSDVWVIDYRAHGKSGGRLAMNDQRCHVSDFQDYLTDMHAIVTKHILRAYPNQSVRFYLMGASLGGHLALRYVQDYPHSFEKLFLIVPMLNFKTNPWPKWMAFTLVKGACLMGLGQKYVVGYGDMNLANSSFNREKSHHNRQAFEETLILLKNNPHLRTSGPTNAWVSAAFDSCKKLMRPQALKGVSIPVSIFAAGEDYQVENSAMIDVQKHIPNCTLTTIDGAWHNLLKESDPYRVEFLKKLAAAFKP